MKHSPIVTILSFSHSLLAKSLILECQEKRTSRIHNVHMTLTVGVVEVVECVIDRCAPKKPIFGISLPIDNILPDYCVVSKYK